MPKTPFDSKVEARCHLQQRLEFSRISKEVHGREPQDLIREFMTALIEGRVKFTPTAEQRKSIQQSTELYHVD